MRTKNIILTGITPLLMHKSNINFDQTLTEWRQNPANKGKQVKGDDRSPGWSWIGRTYHDGQYVGMPSDNIMTMLREGGAKVPTGKRQGTFKRQSQSGLIVLEPLWAIITAAGSTIEWKDIEPLMLEDEFEKNQEEARKYGIEVHAKRVPVGQAKHIRTRPLFAAGWQIQGTICITDDQITDRVFSDILLSGGTYCGLGDWRPSAPKSPGPYGRFTAKIKDVD